MIEILTPDEIPHSVNQMARLGFEVIDVRLLIHSRMVELTYEPLDKLLKDIVVYDERGLEVAA